MRYVNQLFSAEQVAALVPQIEELRRSRTPWSDIDVELGLPYVPLSHPEMSYWIGRKAGIK